MPNFIEARGQYIVESDDGEQFGPFDDRKAAAAKYRELKREQEDGGDEMAQQSQSRAQKAATRFASGVNSAARKAGDAGRRLAETADEKAQQAAEDRETDQADMDADQSQGPTLDSLFGGGGGMGGMGGGESEDGGNAPQLAFMGGGEDRDDPELPFMGGGGGGDGPSLEFLGGGGGGDGGPQLPGFGPPADGSNNADMPGAMGNGPDMNALPFGATEEDTEDEDEYNPMQFF